MAENRQEQVNGGAMASTSTKMSGRVVGIVADTQEPGVAAQHLGAVLDSENYDILWTTPREVLYGREELAADVVILDADLNDVGALCERLKRAAGDDNLAAVLLLALIGENANLASLAALGIDDFINPAAASDEEIKAHLALAVRLGRAERELQATREELRHQIQIDDLSGTLNRRFFFQAAYRECSRARRYGQALSCLMVDIDHFHLYNTSFGYGCGDYMLREVATVLKNSVRDTDLVARFGGSKFVVLLTHTDTEGAIMVRQKIENSVKDGYFLWQHQRLPVTVSIGEAERVPGRSYPNAPDEGEDEAILLSTREDLAELLEDADSALYIAKKGARFPTFLETHAEQAED